MIILDTNVVSELLRPSPDPAVEAWVASQDAADLYLTAIAEAELRLGAAILPEGRRKTLLLEAMDSILREEFGGRILSFDSAAAAAYARIAAERRALGKPISQFDCQIAAIAITQSAKLATRNTSDFEDIELQTVNPWRHPPSTPA